MTEPTPTRRVRVRVTEAPPQADALMLIPRPFGHWGATPADPAVTGASVAPTRALNTCCEALVLTPQGDGPIEIDYAFALDDSGAPEWVWEVQDNRMTVADPALADEAKRVTDGAASPTEAVERLARNAAELFGYAHVETAFNEGTDVVPLVCGVATGNCVDINTYILAGARAAGLRGQYIAGYWFHPEKTQTADMHCWLAFDGGGPEPIYWDVAHGLKWAATLGAQVEPGLNPAGGRRVAMSCGRGLQFETPLGPVEISHFSEPVWLLPSGELRHLDLLAEVTDPVAPPAPADAAARGKATLETTLS